MENKLQLAVDDALFRIKREYDRTNGMIYLAFSGGKDSTVLAELIKMAKLPTDIPFVFANTGIELEATKAFVDSYNYSNVVIVKPRIPYSEVIKKYGKPSISKLKSEALSTHQRNIKEPLKTARQRQMITGIREKGGILIPQSRNSYKLANKHMHFLHEDTEFKVANKCCQYMKKYPFKDFAKENEMNGYFTGVRTAEGGTRSLAYKKCVDIKKVKGKDFYQSYPIIDWDDDVVELFIKKYNVKLSDAYEKYGCKRTGCIGCAYAEDLKSELEMLFNFEPLKYKAVMKWNKDVYMYQQVECDWDQEYMDEYEERKVVIEQRNKEMMEKFRPKH